MDMPSTAFATCIIVSSNCIRSCLCELFLVKLALVLIDVIDVIDAIRVTLMTTRVGVSGAAICTDLIPV